LVATKPQKKLLGAGPEVRRYFTVRHKRLAPPLSGKRHKPLFIFCAVAALLFSHAALAQSGRRPKRDAPSTPPPTVTTAPKVDPEPFNPPLPISSIIVVGDLIQEGKSFSNQVDKAVDACVKRLKERPVINAVGSGSMKRPVAVERAKKETDAYVLWLGIKMEDINMWGDSTIPYIDFIILMPQTAKILMEGRVDPNKEEVIIIGGARLPTPKRRRLDEFEQLEIGGRQIADLVRRKLQ
jgi:hypothetical protein